MSLVDTTDGVMMLGAYDWAFVKPIAWTLSFAIFKAKRHDEFEPGVAGQ